MEEFDRAVYNYHKVKEIDPRNCLTDDCLTILDYPNIKQLIKDTKKRAEKAKKKDFYKILGVDRKATRA